MKIVVEILLTFNDFHTLDTIAKAIEPDNTGFPINIGFNMELIGEKLYLKIDSDNNILKLFSTMDDILGSAQTSINALSKLEVE
jgi:hypothetical protein